jgi:hypothetical protein
MRARLFAPLLFALAPLATGAAAQDAAEEPSSGLFIAVDGAIQEVMDGYDAAMKEFREAYYAAETKEARDKVYAEAYPNPADWYGDLWEIIDSAPKEAGCVKGLVWIASTDRTGTHAGRAGESLLTNHIESEQLGEACWAFARGDNAAAFLSKVMDKSPHAAVRAVAQYNLAKAMLQSDPEGNRERAEELLAEIEANHADVEHPYRGTLGVAAAADLFELRNLAVGMTVPDIAGNDLDGVAFKLSDYRGKVILLDFWGNW